MPSAHINALAPIRHSLSADVDIRPEDAADDVPKLVSTDQVALLANVQDDMATVLLSMRRQASRRTDRTDAEPAFDRDDLPTSSRLDDVQKLLAVLTSARRGGSPLYDLMCGIFPDPSELVLVLAGLRENEDLDESAREELDALLSTLVQEHGLPVLQAGVNVGQVARSFSQGTGLCADGLKKAYRTLVGANTGEAMTYRYLIDTFGFARRGLALEFLEQALAADMAAESPSHTQADFQPLLALLFQLRLLRSADTILSSAARGQIKGLTNGQTGKREPGQDADPMAHAAVDLLLACMNDLKAAARKFKEFVYQWRRYAAHREVGHWVRRLLRAMAAVPCELFPDLAYRRALLDTLYSAGDALLGLSTLPRSACLSLPLLQPLLQPLSQPLSAPFPAPLPVPPWRSEAFALKGENHA